MIVGYCAIAAWAAVLRNAYGIETGCPTTFTLSPRSARRVSKAHSLSPAAISAGSWSLTPAGTAPSGSASMTRSTSLSLRASVTQPLGSLSARSSPSTTTRPVLPEASAGFAVGFAVGSGVGFAVGSGVGSTVGAGVGSRIGVAAGVGGAGVTASDEGADVATWPTAALEGAD